MMSDDPAESDATPHIRMRPKGRPKGRRNASTVERERGMRILKNLAMEHLTEEEIAALLPRDIFRLVAHTAVRMHDLPLMLKAASDWAPYEHPRLASETLNVRNDDSQRSQDEIIQELEDLERRAALAAKDRVMAPRVSDKPSGMVH